MFAEPFLLPTPCWQMKTVRAIQSAQLLPWDLGRVFFTTSHPASGLLWFGSLSLDSQKYLGNVAVTEWKKSHL